MALMSAEVIVLRILSDQIHGRVNARESSLLKILVTENAQAITELYIDLLGEFGAREASRGDGNWAAGLGPLGASATVAMQRYLYTRAQTIYGGTTEIQKNIIAKSVLGLPQ